MRLSHRMGWSYTASRRFDSAQPGPVPAIYLAGPDRTSPRLRGDRKRDVPTAPRLQFRYGTELPWFGNQLTVSRAALGRRFVSGRAGTGRIPAVVARYRALVAKLGKKTPTSSRRGR
jgi:hypothetical protein